MPTGSHNTERPLSQKELQEFIRVARKKGYYRESWHAENDHPERNISPDDVFYGLDRDDWCLKGGPTYDDEHQNFKYLIKTVDIEGDELHVSIAVILSERRFEVITRW